MDLVSLNIQRAREHGIPSYTTVRNEFCKFSGINSFEDLKTKDIMDLDSINKLKRIYGFEVCLFF